MFYGGQGIRASNFAYPPSPLFSADNDSRREFSVEDVGGHIRNSFKESFGSPRMDPPDDEPPSLKKEYMEDFNPSYSQYPDPDTPAVESNLHVQGFFGGEQRLRVNAHGPIITDGFPNQYVSPESLSPSHEQYFQEPLTHDEEQYYQQTPSQRNDEYYDDAGDATPHDGEYYGENMEGPHDQYYEEDEYPNGQYYQEGPSPANGDYYQVEPPTPAAASYYEEESGPNNPRYYEDEPTYYEDAQYYQGNGQLEPEDDDNVEAEGSPFSKATYGASRPATNEDDYNGTDEKKIGLDKEDMDSHSQLDNSADFFGKDGQPERFIDTSSQPYSPHSGGLDSGKSHQSPAMRGAHEILKRNRRRRLEV